MKNLLFFTAKLIVASTIIFFLSFFLSIFLDFRGTVYDPPPVRSPSDFIYYFISFTFCLILGFKILKKVDSNLKKQKIIIMIIIFILTIFISDWLKFVDRAINDRTEIVEGTSTQILCYREELGNRRICDSKTDIETVFLEDSDTLVIRHFFLEGAIPEFESIWGRKPMSIRLEETSFGGPPEQLVEIKINFKDDISLENSEIYVHGILWGGYEIPIE